jgi:hypothetical protein
MFIVKKAGWTLTPLGVKCVWLAIRHIELLTEFGHRAIRLL